MIQSPSEGEDLKRQGFGERRRLEERRSSGERRRTKHRRKGETLSMLRACPPSLQVFSPQDNVALKTPPSQERRDGTQERWQAEERIRLEALLDLCEAMSPEATQQVIHELRVRQVELEAQNEALRRTEVELKTTRSRYFDLYDRAPIGYCSLNERDLILEANLTTTTLLGVGETGLVMRTISQFIAPEDQGLYLLGRQQLLESKAPQSCELRMVKADGTPFWAHLDMALAREPGAYHLMVSDISEHRRMEAENRQLQKSESLGRMAGAIAHLFNNQLQMMMASLELLEELPRGSDPTKYLTMAKGACERAAEVSNLMRVYLGQTNAQQEPCDLAEICQASLHLLRGTLPSTVKLEADCPPPGPVVIASTDQIQRVLMNLLVNAREALGDAPGSLRVGLRTCSATDIPEAHRFPVCWKPEETQYAYLEVSDSGSGVAEADMEKLFDPFFTTKFAGRGLGLPVVLGAIQAYGGALTVESRLGHGSTFRVYLPVFQKTRQGLSTLVE